MIKKGTALFFAFTLLLLSCKSTTIIKSEPAGAVVYINGQKKGETPYTYSDTKIVGSATNIVLKKAGYTDFQTVLTRDEQADAGAIVAGCFFLVPFLWAMEYEPEHNYELEKSDTYSDKNMKNEKPEEADTENTEANSTKELIKLKNLLDEGAITEDDFTTLKVKILKDTYDYNPGAADQIKELYELYQEGLLTESEYNSQKDKILNE